MIEVIIVKLQIQSRKSAFSYYDLLKFLKLSGLIKINRVQVMHFEFIAHCHNLSLESDFIALLKRLYFLLLSSQELWRYREDKVGIESWLWWHHLNQNIQGVICTNERQSVLLCLWFCKIAGPGDYILFILLIEDVPCMYVIFNYDFTTTVFDVFFPSVWDNPGFFWDFVWGQRLEICRSHIDVKTRQECKDD